MTLSPIIKKKSAQKINSINKGDESDKSRDFVLRNLQNDVNFISKSNLFIIGVKLNETCVINHFCHKPTEKCILNILNFISTTNGSAQVIPLFITIKQPKFVNKKFNIGIENWNDDGLENQSKYFAVCNSSPPIPLNYNAKYVDSISFVNTTHEFIILQFKSLCKLNCFTCLKQTL